MSRQSKRRRAKQAIMTGKANQQVSETAPVQQNSTTNGEKPFTPTGKQAAFLAAYAETGVILQAAEAAGCERTSHNHWLAVDPTYPARFADAQAAANDRLEAEARRRAVQGVEKVKFYKGAPIKIIDEKTGNPKVYTEHEYSDRLLEFLLKGELADKYAERVKTENVNTILDPAEQAAMFDIQPEFADDTPPTSEAPNSQEAPDAGNLPDGPDAT